MRNFFGYKRNIVLLSVAVATAVLCILLPENLISYKIVVRECNEFKIMYLILFTVLNVLLLIILLGVYALT